MALWGIGGLPGASKTLFTIDWVEREFVKKQGRKVFYCKIEFEKDIGWTAFDDPLRWRELPHGSVLVVDEAHYFFPQRQKGKPPAEIQELTEHRHYGLDIVLLSQHFANMDVFVRRLLGHFRVIERKSGMERSRVYEFEKYTPVDENPVFWAKTKKTAHKAYTYRFNKKYYGVYKSAEVHTVRRNLPWGKLALLGLALSVVGVAAWVGLGVKSRVEGSAAAPAVHATAGAPKAASGGFLGHASGSASTKEAPMTAAEYVSSFSPRVEGLPFSAPRYDEITKPVEAPVPAACVVVHNKCTCYTQQSTKIRGMPDEVCRDIATNGFFMDFDPGSKRRETEQRVVASNAAPVQAAEAAPMPAPVQPVQLPVQVVPVAMTGGPKNRQMTPIDLAAFPEDDPDKYRPRRPFER